jgi:hypothetical protein
MEVLEARIAGVIQDRPHAAAHCSFVTFLFMSHFTMERLTNSSLWYSVAILTISSNKLRKAIMQIDGVAVKPGNNSCSEGYVRLHITIYFYFSALTVTVFRTEKTENTARECGILFNFLACDK